MNPNQSIDTFYFEGAKAMNGTIGGTALSDQSTPDGGPIARVTSNAHGLTVTGYSGIVPYAPAIYIQSMANAIYNGIHRVNAVATNTFDIVLGSAFAALTPAGTETWFVGCSYKVEWKLVGFDLHMSAAGGTSENLVVTIDAAAGAVWDTPIYSQDMNVVQSVVKQFDPVIELNPYDVIKFSYANTNSRTWGLRLHAIYGE